MAPLYEVADRVTRSDVVRPAAPPKRRWWLAAGGVLLVGYLFIGYLAIARTTPANADGASNAMQAWDMLHGNVMLRGWSVTDVSFYTNELLINAVVELLYGYRADTIHVAAALTYTLLVLVVAAVARGRATGREAVFRIAAAVAIVGVPVLGMGASVQLSAPDHTGTAIPLLLAWLALERGKPWLVSVVLALGVVSDPLVLYIGVLPLVVVCGYRLLRRRSRSDGYFVAAGLAAVVFAQVALIALRLAGGFGIHSPEAEFAPIADLPEHVRITAQTLSVDFGAFFPNRAGAFGTALGVLHLVGLLTVGATVGVVAVRLLRSRGDDRVVELAAVGILVNVGAYAVSTLPGDLGTSRQVVAVVPLGAVLVGRVWGPRLATARLRVRLGMAAVLVALAVELAVQSTARPVVAEGHEVAAWLDQQGLRYGIGSYWMANNVTVDTSGRVRVAPVTGGDTLRAYRWESRADWYDPALHDARFVVVDKRSTTHGTEAGALRQFGQPVARHEFAEATVLVYDRNLLSGLTAYCVPEGAPSIAECPGHRIPRFW